MVWLKFTSFVSSRAITGYAGYYRILELNLVQNIVEFWSLWCFLAGVKREELRTWTPSMVNVKPLDQFSLILFFFFFNFVYAKRVIGILLLLKNAKKRTKKMKDSVLASVHICRINQELNYSSSREEFWRANWNSTDCPFNINFQASTITYCFGWVLVKLRNGFGRPIVSMISLFLIKWFISNLLWCLPGFVCKQAACCYRGLFFFFVCSEKWF